MSLLMHCLALKNDLIIPLIIIIILRNNYGLSLIVLTKKDSICNYRSISASSSIIFLSINSWSLSLKIKHSCKVCPTR